MARYAYLRTTTWSDASLLRLVNEFSTQVDQTGAAQRHYDRWGTLCPAGLANCHGIWPFNPDQTALHSFAEYKASLVAWMDARVKWMDSQLCGTMDVQSCSTATDSVRLGKTVPLAHTGSSAVGSMCTVTGGPGGQLDKATDQCSAGTFTKVAIL